MTEDTNNQSAVYFLVKVTGERFKIGRATDVRTREKRIEGDIDTEKSWALYFSDDPDQRLAIRCERLLQDLFIEDRCPAFAGDGGTEWFLMRAFGEVASYVQENQKRLGWSHRKEGLDIFFRPTPTTHRKARTRNGKVAAPFWLPEEKRKRLKLEAARLNTTQQAILESLVDEWLASR